MLKIKKPIKLQTQAVMEPRMAAFGEGILGNYEGMSAQVLPKDLLYLFSGSPEFPEDLGPVTSINLKNSFVNVSKLSIQMLNRIVNRVLLTQEQKFHYQDQVYLTQILRKLGVTNVSAFLRELREVSVEQQQQRALIRLYREAEKARGSGMLPATGEDSPRPRVTLSGAQPEDARATNEGSEARYYLHSRIYERLQTEELYRTMNEQRITVQGGDLVSQQHLQLAEHQHMTQSLQLQRLRRDYTKQDFLLHRHVERVPLSDEEGLPKTEDAVLQQASEAALFGLIQQVLIQKDRSVSAGGEILQVRLQSITNTAERNLWRLEQYYRDGLEIRQEERMLQELHSSFQTQEREMLERLLQTGFMREMLYERERLVTEVPSGAAAGSPSLTLTQLQQQTVEEGDTYHEQQRQSEHTRHTETLHRESREIHSEQTRQETARFSEEHSREIVERERIGDTLQQYREAAPIEGADGRMPPSVTLTERVVETGEHEQTREVHRQETRELTNLTQKILQGSRESVVTQRREENRRIETRQRELRTESVRLYRQSREIETALFALTERERELQLLRELTKTHDIAPALTVLQERFWAHTEEQTKIFSAEVTQPVTQIFRHETSAEEETAYRPATEMLPRYTADPPREIETAPSGDPEVRLGEAVRTIEERNRERYERVVLREMERKTEQQSTPQADLRRTKELSLAALQNPAAVLAQLQEEQEATPFQLPSELQTILAEVDPATRTMYEMALAYQRDPEAAKEAGIIKPASLGALLSDTARPAPEEVPAPTELIQRVERAEAREDVQEAALYHVMEELPRALQTVEAQAQPRGYPKQSLVLKHEDHTAMEEFIERIAERQVKDSAPDLEIHETPQESTVQEVVVQEQTRQITQQTNEDLSELVSRTMARQMNLISEQVYQQMERKLQSERMRRGRF